jgi:hypothetical protein
MLKFEKEAAMKTFRQLFRATMLVLLVGGWSLASAAVHVIRVPGQWYPVVITKARPTTFHDTYVDTRTWTISDDAAHADVVARLIQLNETGVLAHTVNTTNGAVQVQLMAAIAQPGAVANAGVSKTVMDVAKAK